MAVEMKPVSSANIKAVGYDQDAKELHVEFRSGPTYVHPNVTAEQSARLMSADSKGKFYAQAFRGNPDHPHRILPRPAQQS